MSFGKQMQAYARKRRQQLDKVVRASLLELSSAVIMRTPVDQGGAVGNWQPSIGSPASGTLPDLDKNGQATIAKAAGTIQGAVGEVYWLTNNLPYISVLEYGLYGTGEYATNATTRDGYSVKAPNGMLRISITEFESKLARAIQASK
jgi:hypothetical protein